MAGRILSSVILLGAALLLGSCHFFDDSNDVDNALDNCPLNWGYPCPCDATHYGSKCGDNSVCLYHTDPTRGFCSPECTEAGGTQECLVDHKMTADYGVLEKAAICAHSPALSPSNQCMVICELVDFDGQRLEGQCPPGTRCDVYLGDGNEMKACLPIPEHAPTDAEIAIQQSCMSYCLMSDECAREFNKAPALTFEDCKANCIYGKWHEDPCGSCMIGCQSTGSCVEFSQCHSGCPCLG